MKTIGRIWLPAAVFVAFLIMLLNRREIYQDFLENGKFISESIFTYGTQIGAWLSSAFLINRIINIFFWDGFIGKLSDRKVPKLPKDLTAIVLFSIAGLLIASTVFDKDTTKILAASGAVSTVGIDDWPRIKAREFIEDLTVHTTQPQYQYRHQWQEGDAVFIDNRRVLHAGTYYDMDRYERLLHRTMTIETEPPV